MAPRPGRVPGATRGFRRAPGRLRRGGDRATGARPGSRDPRRDGRDSRHERDREPARQPGGRPAHRARARLSRRRALRRRRLLDRRRCALPGRQGRGRRRDVPARAPSPRVRGGPDRPLAPGSLASPDRDLRERSFPLRWWRRGGGLLGLPRARDRILRVGARPHRLRDPGRPRMAPRPLARGAGTCGSRPRRTRDRPLVGL